MESRPNSPRSPKSRAPKRLWSWPRQRPLPTPAELDARLAKNPDDHEARFDLAGAQMAAGDRDGAADALLEIIGRDKEWNDGAARKRFLQLLEVQGLGDPWSAAQRRRLSALLFT